jgi:hypothetical protein
LTALEDRLQKQRDKIVPVGVRLPKSLHRRISALAKREGISLNEWCLRALGTPASQKAPKPTPPAAPDVPKGYRRWTFSGTLDAQSFANKADVIAYIHDAVGTMCGCYMPPGAYDDPNNPGDPMWRTQNVQSVKVSRKNKT